MPENGLLPRFFNPHQADVSESLIRKLAILAIFLHSMQQKGDQGTLGRQTLTLIGSRNRLGPSMDPAMALQNTQHGLFYIRYIFAFYVTQMGSRDSEDTKVNPHWF